MFDVCSTRAQSRSIRILPRHGAAPQPSSQLCPSSFLPAPYPPPTRPTRRPTPSPPPALFHPPLSSPLRRSQAAAESRRQRLRSWRDHNEGPGLLPEEREALLSALQFTLEARIRLNMHLHTRANMHI